MLGVLFSVPLRRSLIVEQQLAFPEGRAAAEVLRAGENPAAGHRRSWASPRWAAVSPNWPRPAACAHSRHRLPRRLTSARRLGYVGTNLSPALLGVGYIVGFNIGIVIVAGSIISWNIVIPIYRRLFLDHNPQLAARVAGTVRRPMRRSNLWAQHIRYLGVGAMLVGGVWTLIRLRGSLRLGHPQRPCRGARRRAGADRARTERDLPMKWILIGIVLFTMPLGLLYQQIVGSIGGEPADDHHHDRGRVPVLLGVRVHGRPGRLIQQPGLRHHDRDDPVRRGRAARC